jgi:hypothetical protein
MLRNKLVLAAAAFICIEIIAVSLYARYRERQPQPVTQTCVSHAADTTEAGNVQVFATRTGMWYHRGTCKELQKSRIPVKLSQVRPYRKPCPKCRPPR